MAYGIVRTDNMYGTDVRAALVSIKYMGEDGATPTAIENGSVLKVGALIEGEREIYVGGAVAANDKVEDVVLVASPEVMYDERKKNLDESVTKEALTGEAAPAVGNVVELAEGTKLSVAKDATGATVVGTIIAVDVVGRYTYYAIKAN